MEYAPGQDIFDTGAECIVNPVNCHAHKLKPGWQKGLAGAFEKRFPEVQEPFKAACEKGLFKPGGVQMIRVNRETGARDPEGHTVIANLATKDHWRDPSRMEWVDEGLGKLAAAVEKRGLRSVALPMLGAGLGGLPWEKVRASIETHFRPLSEKGVKVTVLGEGPEKAPRGEEQGVKDHAKDDNIYVAGIGARDTPDTALAKMRGLGKMLANKGLVLRSGGAEGADSAFEEGWDSLSGRKEIFLGWPGFQGRRPDGKSVFHKEMTEDTQEVQIARKYYEQAWNARGQKDERGRDSASPWMRLGRGGKSLMARNTNQMYGRDVGTSKMTDLVICWTKNGETVGGTGQALRIAEDKKIPVLNLGDPRVKSLDARGLRQVAYGLLEGKSLDESIPARTEKQAER